jgi:uncharacterized protein (DUF983 family)
MTNGYYVQDQRPTGPHFVLIVGIMTMVAPYIMQAFGKPMSPWISYISWALIAIGIVLTIMRNLG